MSTRREAIKRVASGVAAISAAGVISEATNVHAVESADGLKVACIMTIPEDFEIDEKGAGLIREEWRRLFSDFDRPPKLAILQGVELQFVTE